MGRPPWHLRPTEPGSGTLPSPPREWGGSDPSAARILVLEDSPELAARNRRLLAQIGTVTEAVTTSAAIDAIATGRFDVALCTYPFDATIGLEVLDDLYLASPGMPCIVLSDNPGDIRSDPRASRVVALLPRTDLDPSLLRDTVAEALGRGGDARTAGTAAQYEAILDSVDDGVMLVSATGRIVGTNSKGLAIFGLVPDDRGAETIWDLPGPPRERPNPSRREHPVARAIEQNGSVTAVREIVRRSDGAHRWVEFTAHPLVVEGESRPYAATLAVRDVTDRRAAESVRRSVERREVALAGQAADGYVIVGTDGRIYDASPRIMSDRRLSPTIGSRAIALVEPTSRRAFMKAFFDCRDRPAGPVRVRLTMTEEDGDRRVVDATFTNWIAEPSVAGIVVNFHDVTELARLEDARSSQHGTFELTFEHASIGMAVLDLSFRLERANPALLKLLGRRLEELVGHNGMDFVHPEDRETARTDLDAVARGLALEYHASRRYIRAGGDVIWVNIDGVVVRDSSGQPLQIIVQFQDVTERRRSADALAHQSLHDGLTGLPNRRLLYGRLERAIESSSASTGGVAVIYVDIDRFQGVTDTFGHAAGDDLLTQIAGRIASGLLRSDTLARFGVDEFVIVRDRCDDVAAAALGDNIVRRFDTPFRVENEEIRLTASVGVVLVDEFGSASYALRDSDAAAGRAKELGGGRSEIFDAELRHTAARRFGLEQSLSRAIDEDELRVVYQPIIDLASLNMVGFEALLRWNSPEWGDLSPTKIIEIAESTGQIAQIGELVLSAALQDVARARLAAGPDSRLWVSVNLSSREFAITDPVARCAAMLAEYGVSPDALRFELTETAVMEDVEESINELGRLRGLGVKVALDDFGTGHSSLAYLSRMPISAIKIDHSFVWSLADTARDRAIIEAVVTMAKTLGIEICAEGVESEEQRALLEHLGCDNGQGFFFAAPLETDELLAYIAAGLVMGEHCAR